MTKSILIPVFIFISLILRSQPATWTSTGIGGGGAFFSASINPANDNEYYVGSDMSDLFNTTDFGLSYSMINFMKIEGGQYSAVQWTNNSSILYCVDHTERSPGFCPLPVKSTDGGNTWTVLSGDPDLTESTYGIFADYNNPNHVIISFYGSIWFSSNGGTNFTKIRSAVNSNSGILIAGVFFDGNNIYIGTNNGLLVSTNGGSNFTMSSVTGIPSSQAMFSFAGAKSGTVTRFFCLTGDTNDIYVGETGSDYYNFIKGVYSLDYGSGNWVSKLGNINVNQDFLMFVGMARNSIDTVYLGGSTNNSTPNVMKTNNAGSNWTHVFNTGNNQNIATGWSGQNGDHGWSFPEALFTMAVAPNNANKVIIGDYSCIHKTSDGGTSWKQAYLSAADQNPSGSNTPVKKIYHGIGLENTSCWQVYWFDSLNIFGAFTDISGVRSTDGGKSWSFNFTGHSGNTMYRMVKNISNSTIYAGTSNIHDMYESTRLQDAQLDASDPNGKVLYTTDKGATWQLLHLFSHPVFWVATDPSNSNRLYASVIHHSLGGIFVSNDIQNGASSTWQQLPNPPRTEGHPASIAVLKDGKVLCTYSGRISSNKFTASSGTFIYDPGTSKWTDISDAGMDYWTKDIVIDPFDTSQSTWYVCVFSGWGGAPNGLGGLYRTTNRGLNWTRIFSGDRETSCTFNMNKPGELYVTTESQGLWYSSNINQTTPTFSQLMSYPFKQPERVFFNPYRQNEIWVSSMGGGMRYGTTGTSTGIEDKPEAANNFQIYPNPCAGNFFINFNQQKPDEIKIFDMTGKVVYYKQLNQSENTNGISLTNFAEGIYCCVIKAGDGFFVKKVVVR